MTYNLTGLADLTGLGGLVAFANTTTEGHLIGMFIVAAYFITIIKLKHHSFDTVFFAASWICFTISALLAYVHWINLIYPITFLIAAAGSVAYIFTTKN